MYKIVKVLSALTLSACLSFVAQAQEVPIDEWQKRQNIDGRLTAFGEDLIGDAIDPHTGSLVFTHTDVSVPGNSALQVAITRRRVSGFLYDEHEHAEFGDWELITPRLKVTAAQAWTGNRCSNSFAQSFPNQWVGSTMIPRWEYSNGLEVDAPGYGTQQLLSNPSGNHWPSAAQYVTSDNWYFTCTSAVNGGQGFLGHSGDGKTYKFNRYISRQAEPNLTYGAPSVARRIEMLAATEVTDANGNWVKYDYDSAGRLTRIHSNDGRSITVSYSGSSKLVSSVTTNGRTWSYNYARSTYTYPEWQLGAYTRTDAQKLTQVNLPDGRKWEFTLDEFNTTPTPSTACSEPTATISLKHPTGTTGTFKIKSLNHRYVYASQIQSAQNCPIQGWGGGGGGGDMDLGGGGAPPPSYPLVNNATTAVVSVLEKKLTGPSVPTATWTYQYEQDTSSGTSGNDRTNWTKVTGPGVHITYFHNWVSEPSGGSLVRQEVRASAGGGVLEKIENTLMQEQNVGSVFGSISVPGAYRGAKPNRTTQVKTTRGSDIYTRNLTYDSNYSSANYSFGNPIQISETSSVSSGSRTALNQYEHNSTKWILGLPKKVTKNGKVFGEYVWDSLGRMTQAKMFGTTMQTVTYNSDGTVATVKDALNRQWSASGWKRGSPQTLTRPDGNSFSRVIDNNGWVTSETDARGTAFSFGYDIMGRLTNVNRPGSWADTSLSYAHSASGVTQTVTRGNSRSVIAYDTFLRPTLVQEVDLSGNSGARFVKTTYDALGRVIFTSFPSFSSNPTTGTNTTYDALGRVTQMQENVAPFATTATAYLPGNKSRVTDPSGAQTTTTFQAYGSPSMNKATSIQQPLGMTTSMAYDVWGNLVSATQGGFTQTWTYDSRLRVCNHYAPEEGGTVYDYNDANEVTYMLRGGIGCGSNSGNRVFYTYDQLGRTTLINYPGGTPDVSITYDANGNVMQNSRGGAVWTYAYNDMDMLTSEVLSIDGRTYASSYGYDSTGNLSSQNTPGGLALSYAPNGLGQPTKASVGGYNYASAATYHANGSVKHFNTGNSRYFETTQDARQLTNMMHYSYGFVHHLGYDQNGRVVSVDDQFDNSRDRTYGYDALGRLTSANGEWGAATYQYDGVNNLTRKQLGSRVVEIEFDGSNRVSRARDSGAGNAWQNYAHDTRGNVIDNGPITFTYDAAMQPVSISGSDSGTFTYDGLHKRVKQVINGKTIYSVYSLSGQLMYRDNVTAGEATDFIRMGGKLIAEKTNGTITYLYQDHLGTPIMGAETADVTWSERYTPFGEKWAAAGQANDNVGFTGHVTDTDTGLTYMQARYYDPVIGRFLSTDPVGFAEMGPGYFNRYAYVGNDPVNYYDPDGRENCHVTFGCRINHHIKRSQGLPRDESLDGPGPLAAPGVAILSLAIPDPTDFAAGAIIGDRLIKGGRSIFGAFASARAASVARQGFDQAQDFVRKNTDAFTGNRRSTVSQRSGSGGQEAAESLFNKLTGGESKEISGGGRVGSLRDGSGVQISSRVSNGVRQTSVRVTAPERTGSRIRKSFKVRFEEATE
ncbi:MAG: RHS repeat-associated core domain-containing protein [Pseudomonadota bacterium]